MFSFCRTLDKNAPRSSLKIGHVTNCWTFDRKIERLSHKQPSQKKHVREEKLFMIIKKRFWVNLDASVDCGRSLLLVFFSCDPHFCEGL